MSDERARRVAKNEALFREVNERIEDIAIGTEADFLCECGDPSCTQPITLSLAAYEALRSDSNLFALIPCHEQADVENVVERHERYVVVRKREGLPAELAEATDPRG